jgi:NAD(P)-dependent dehydrogenase (short-subunit alcohol dehydrogenase family)
MGDALDQFAAASPAGRVGSPQEIANTILFLSTDAASFIQGAVIPVDGGRAAV